MRKDGLTYRRTDMTKLTVVFSNVIKKDLKLKGILVLFKQVAVVTVISQKFRR